MPLPKNFSFVPEKNFQLTEKLQEPYEEFPYSPCTNSSVVPVLCMRCHPLYIYAYISIIITLFMNHLRASCRQETVSLQTKQDETLHFPKRGHSPMPVWPSTWKINMIYHCSTQSPEPIQNHQHRLLFHLIRDPVRKHVSYSSVYTPADPPVWKGSSSLPLPFVTFKGTALSFWKNPQPVSF